MLRIPKIDDYLKILIYKELIIKISSTKKIKAINNKVERIKAQCDLGRQMAKFSTLSIGNGSKYKFLTDKDVLAGKDLFGKVVTMKRFNYSSLGKELKVPTDIAKKQYQKLGNNYEYDRIKK